MNPSRNSVVAARARELARSYVLGRWFVARTAVALRAEPKECKAGARAEARPRANVDQSIGPQPPRVGVVRSARKVRFPSGAGCGYSGACISFCPCKARRLTLPSSGQSTGYARRLPLKSNVRQMQNTALMQRLARFPVAVGSPAERGGKSVLGCSPFGSQRSVAAPRSIAAFLVRGEQRLSVVRQEFQGQHCLSPTFGSASSFCLSQTRAPNPAFERTGQRPAAQGQR